MGGLLRCPACGQVHWSLRPRDETPQTCRDCGEELRVERRRPGRRLTGTLKERRDAPLPSRADRSLA